MNSKLYFGATILWLSLLDSGAIHFKSRSNFKTKLPCALTGGSLLARNSFWKHICKSRRLITVRDLTEFASRERGPPRTDKYNPTYGYEPYWEFGDWVFDKIKPKKNESTMCGARCPKAYLLYGKLCSVNKYFYYKTYESYCEMREADCEDFNELRPVYRGKCIPDLYTYPTEAAKLADRAGNFINGYYGRTPTTTINVNKGWFGKR